MSETLLVDSTSPIACPTSTSASTSGSETNTMSPNASCAYWVMPTRTTPSSFGVVTHSWSDVYFSSSGYTAGSSSCDRWVRGESIRPPGRRARRSPPPVSVLLDCRRRDRLAAGDLAVRAGPAQRLEHPAGDVHRRLHGVRVADRLDPVRRLEHPPVDHHPVVGVEEVGVDGDAHRADLEHLGPGVAQLLHGVEQVAGADRALGVADHQLDAGAGGRLGPGEDGQRVLTVLRRPPGRLAVLALQRRLLLLQPGDLLAEVLLSLVQPVQQPHQLGLAQVVERRLLRRR